MPRVRVLFDDDAEHEVQIVNVDMTSFDRERARHRDWPTAEDGPMFWASYLAWHALRRTGVFEHGYNQFEQHALQVEMINTDEEVDPTRSAAEPA